ncbi:DEAD/DEAH box helicase [Rhodococcus sp. PvR099]|uniref:DEAD/DEAH box helicase n=1 Tax=Rhodococcus sp. PvR099 TaxID=2806602 RepID=UPI001AE60A40|nr:DEAD/DEAH box helicase family protein [Rhodococcus sp. PvR099]MBP1159815.1 superfamily II DNA or RNA helicase [Rhodococcus sp. PvR099]
MTEKWIGREGVLADHVRSQTEQCLAAYGAKPNLIEQDAGIELSNIEGGYGRKQLHELVQNAADAMVHAGGRIALVLSNGVLYCANEGRPLTATGIETLMASHISRKRDDEIGRFGLGFKSVLGICDAPEIISRDVSIRFDRGASADLVRAIDPAASRTPVLRIGFPFDPYEAAKSDMVLADLMRWASTIVRLPLVGDTDWLGDKLLAFPSEFLLFAKHVNAIDLRNDDSGDDQSWSAERDGSRIVLTSGNLQSTWNVFRASHKPSADARKDAGEISGRGVVDVAWAVPLKGRNKVGSFWSYFPTNSGTSLTGIVNAPFKTNEDRHDILDGLYNREILLSVLPDLVASNLAELVDPDDPGSILDLLPSRGREARSWADDAINEPILKAASRVPCLPDMDGMLTLPEKIKLQPGFLSDFDSWKPRWAAVAGRPADWVHGSVDRTAERRYKAERLVGLSGSKPYGVGEWLHDLAAGAGVVGSQEAIKLARLVDTEASDHMLDMRRAKFVLAADGSLRLPSAGKIFLPESDDETGAEFVHPAVVADGDAATALAALGIGRLDQLGRLRAHVVRMTESAVTGAMLEELWSLTRGLRVADAASVLSTAFGAGGAPVRTLARRHAAVADVLLPGVIVPADGSRDVSHAIDTAFHARDLELLRAIGASSEPTLGQPDKSEAWFASWVDAARAAYVTWVADHGHRVTAARVRILSGTALCGLDMAEQLSEEGRKALTDHVLRVSTKAWTLDATSSAGLAMPYTNPAVWWVRQHGVVDTAYGLRPVRESLASIAGVPDEVLPVARISPEHAQLLGLADRIDSRDWERILARPFRYLDQDRLNQLYSRAALVGAPAPDELGVTHAAAKTLTAPEETYVTDSRPDYDAMTASGYPAVLAEDERTMTALMQRWGLVDARTVISRTVMVAASGDPISLADKFPGLRAFVPTVPDVNLTPCSELSVELSTDGGTGNSVTEHILLRDGEKSIYFRDDLSDDRLLELVVAELHLSVSTADRQKVHTIGARGEANRLRQRVKAEANEDRKLVMLAGVDALEKEIPAGAKALAERRLGKKLTPDEIAGMARASRGSSLLTRLAPAIEEKGVVLPKLSGGVQAATAVKELGLSPDYAGSRVSAPAARFQVIGPVALPPLHDYQERVVTNLLEMLRPGGDNRGIVALPTGSGKTRVAVESLIRHVKQSDTEPLIIWIAQSEELCEQAVDTWSYTWSALAPAGARLTISRLWGANDAAPADDGAHLVVATDAKLLSLARRSNHEWLTNAEVVLVDEAHTSISKTYTELFRWLKRGTKERDRALLGLSASPYRGHNEDQTKALINRYDANLLTDGVFDGDPHEVLQEMGILARVRHLELDGMTLTPGKPRKASEAEAMHLDDYRIDLNAVAADTDRNRAILDSLEKLPTDMTALVFAASVQHAQVLAAVLSSGGIPAASIDGFTPAPERRRLIQKFRSGEIRVLTNYNVLSQGFDAPKVGAVYVARPTFSPNRYQQMIGRGLRGPANGGSEEVLIVNVKDNIDAFGTQLAFHHFDGLWRR